MPKLSVDRAKSCVRASSPDARNCSAQAPSRISRVSPHPAARSALFLSSILFASLSAALSSASTLAAEQGREVWLIGGGEPICSSVEPDRCVADKRAEAEAWFAAREAFRGKTFRWSAQARQTLDGIRGWPGNAARRQQVLAALDARSATLSAQDFAETDWQKQFADLQLSDDEQNLLDDLAELRPLRRDGSSQIMAVYFPGTASYVQDLFRSFLGSAAERAAQRERNANAKAVDKRNDKNSVKNDKPLARRPRLLLITASSNNPLEWVDYYLQLFTAAGADAEWLPLEPALAQGVACDALNDGRFVWNGQYNRAARYPELSAYQQKLCRDPEAMLNLIDRADAVFINGGDQSLTMRALQNADGRFNVYGERLLARIAAGVPLAGSSAGTAVQSGRADGRTPMISGGRSSHALLHGALAEEPDAPLCAVHARCTSTAQSGQLTYRDRGGLGSFTLGIADTHFRERDREGRLLRLLLDTHTHAGFGVDEATALRVNFVGSASLSGGERSFSGQSDSGDSVADLQVHGRGGVWIADARDAAVRRFQDGWSVRNMRVSRLLAGDRARWQNGLRDVKLQCAQDLPVTDIAAVDAAAYAPGESWRWFWQADHLDRTTAPLQRIAACVRDDGRWRYANLPLALQVSSRP